VAIARSARTAVFPARFVLVGATNPCPCGLAGDAHRTCRCTPQQTDRYRARLSGPLRDRLDLAVDVPALPADLLAATASGESSASVRARTVRARQLQIDRYAGSAARTNAELSAAQLAVHCRPDEHGLQVLAAAVRRLGLSARAYDRVRKVARTIADLEGADLLRSDHIAEALQFRMTY
jgi:magnesium chelatase family protein